MDYERIKQIIEHGTKLKAEVDSISEDNIGFVLVHVPGYENYVAFESVTDKVLQEEKNCGEWVYSWLIADFVACLQQSKKLASEHRIESLSHVDDHLSK